MYLIEDVSAADKALIEQALKSETREFKQRVSFGYWTIKNGIRVFNKSFEITSVNSASIKQTACSDSSTLTFGCCCSNSAELEFFNPNYGAETSAESKYNGKIIFIEQAIKYKDGTDEDGNEYFYWFPFGYFKTETATSDDKWFTVKVTAYDDVYLMTDRFNTNLFADGAESVSAYVLINELASRYNLRLGFGAIEKQLLRQAFLTVEQAETLTSYSDAQALGYLAGIAGANARINTLGCLNISWYSTPESYFMPTTVQWQNGLVKKSEDVFEINSITAGADDDVYTCGTGLGLSSVNPVISQTNVANIWTHLFQAEPAISFLPCEIDWRGDPRIEAGDCISVYDETGTAYDVFIAEQSIDLTGGLSAKITCPTGDGDMSFDTLEEATRRALNKQKSDLQKAIETATNSINGAKGGFFEIIDSDSDGNPDGWLIKEDEGGSSGIIKANKAGIGLSKDGGKTYKTAITYDGINSDALICDDLSSISAKIGGWNISENCIYNELSTAESGEVIFACGVTGTELEKANFVLYKDGTVKLGGDDFGYIKAQDSMLEFYSLYLSSATSYDPETVLSGSIAIDAYIGDGSSRCGDIQCSLRPLEYSESGTADHAENCMKIGRRVSGYIGTDKDDLMHAASFFNEYVRITDGLQKGFIHTGYNTTSLFGVDRNNFAGLIHHRTINGTDALVKYGLGGVDDEPSIACEVWNNDELLSRIDVYKKISQITKAEGDTCEVTDAIRIGHTNKPVLFGTDSAFYNGTFICGEVTANAAYLGGVNLWDWLQQIEQRISNLGG